MNKPKKVALAYSGGLDTSVIIPWLKENYGCEVVAVCGDIGQGEDELAGPRSRRPARPAPRKSTSRTCARSSSPNTSGAWCAPAASTSTSTCSAPPSRARCSPRSRWKSRSKTGCDALAHGCTGKGNDQVRFELTYKALAPHLPVIAPWREWNIVSREDAIEYAAAHNVPISADHHQDLQPRPQHLAHLARGRRAGRPGQRRAGRDLDAHQEPQARRPTSPAKSPSASRRACRFRSTASTHGARSSLLETLNRIGAEHGIGRIDLVENRFVGMKSRGCYETPGGTLIMCGASRTRSAHARQEHAALQAAARARLRRAGLQRLLVHAAARGARRLLRDDQRAPPPAK